MANPKPKKTNNSAKKSSNKPEKTETKKEVVSKPAIQTASAETSNTSTMKGFFARKCDKNENVLTIFKTPKIWGALLGELIGTMFITMFMLTLGFNNPLYLVIVMIGVYAVIVGISGANLNPLVTAGMMATRRMSAIRGVLYMLAQVLGAWIGLIIINAFRLSSGTTYELPMMDEITGETFWTIALIELLGAAIIAFCFARSLRYARRNPLVFSIAVTSAVTLAIVTGSIISGFFAFSGNTFMFNPATALMYQILPTTADGFGELAALAGLALAAYIVIPMVGGIVGFYLSDITTRLSDGGYTCDDCCDKHCDKHCDGIKA